MKHVVYEFHFTEDGYKYFGITTEDRVKERYEEHRRGSPTGNKELTRRLQEGWKHTYEVVSRHATEEEARQEEQRRIDAAKPKVLNET